MSLQLSYPLFPLFKRTKRIASIGNVNHVIFFSNCIKLLGVRVSNFAVPEYLMIMKEKENSKHLPGRQTGAAGEVEFPGYPSYPSSEDIFSKYQEEKEINPEDITKTKELNVPAETSKVKELNEGLPAGDLDIPGSELDDEMEMIGSEDEENNYYSIGGDDHNDLDENKGE